jgi:hypothetical protein
MIQTTHKNCSFVLFVYATWCAIVSPWKNLFSHFLLETLQWEFSYRVNRISALTMEHNNKHRKESHCNLFQTQLANANSRERSLQASVQSTKTDIQKMCHERCEIWQFVGSWLLIINFPIWYLEHAQQPKNLGHYFQIGVHLKSRCWGERPQQQLLALLILGPA